MNSYAGRNSLGVSEFERLSREYGWRIEAAADNDGGLYRTPTDDTVQVSFPTGFNHQLSQIESVSPWYLSRNDVIHFAFQSMVSPGTVVWDVGAGTGFVARRLIEEGIGAIAVEPSLDGAWHSARVAGVPTICGTFEKLQLPDSSLGAVGCFDVIEHLSDPRSLCAEIARVLRPGGVLVVTVPAFPWLWSHFDLETGHFARYTRATLKDLMNGFPLRCEWSSYFMFSYLLPVLLCRTLRDRLIRRDSREKVLERSLGQIAGSAVVANKILSAMLFCEFKLMRRVGLPIGTSVIGVFRKTS